MSTEENKARIRKYIDEAWNKGNVDIIDEMMAPDYARYPNGPGKPLNREEQKQRIVAYRKAFPDFHLTIEDLVAEGDKVVFRMTGRGTHRGTFMGTPPGGKQMTISIIDIARFADGKIVEHWGNRDDLGMLQQIGAIPSIG
ncbi:MAG TPA: ester cyclase [Ktedonobacteraceae bacterium]|nr:ester cyclase [Ktedonobacteraceae bacterium]